ncbi:uncharacterized protein [Atheta coriaria]|uniref:uncharacterized protein isoform X1 n=1 Tax=Dalotia coriaria TaxID=877792 RepID=UPI0031F3D345
MPRHCVVPRLETLCVSAVGNFVVSLAPTILSTIHKHHEPQIRLQKSIDRISTILATHVPLYLYDGMALEVLEAVKQLIERTKKNYYMYFNTATFMTEMYVAVGLTEVVLDPHLKQISFSCWPKIMRYVLYKNLFKLTGLEVLNLGSCTNGSSDYEPYIIQGISQMSHLRLLCLCFDCTDNIIQVLSESCPNLQILDVTSSRSVTDRSIPHLLKCTQLYDLNLHRTSVSVEGLGQLLLGLYRLQDIGRCDDFGAVLSYINSKYPKIGPIGLRKIHTRDLTTDQLRMLVDTCPNLENVSLFHDEQFSNLQVLAHLDHLKMLKLLSCDFYGDYARQLLEVRGCNITSLHLEHVEQIDLKAIMDISQYCPRLKNLVLYNCDLTDQAAGYSRSFKVKPFQCLERLFWVVDCALVHLEFVLMHCTNIKYIHLGSSTGICHSSIVKIMGFNPMRELEELRILYSTDMSTNTVELLLANCTNLRVISELENWQGISIDELEIFRKFIHSNNYDLDIRPILSY